LVDFIVPTPNYSTFIYSALMANSCLYYVPGADSARVLLVQTLLPCLAQPTPLCIDCRNDYRVNIPPDARCVVCSATGVQPAPLVKVVLGLDRAQVVNVRISTRTNGVRILCLFRIALSFLEPLANAVSSDANGTDLRTARRRRFADNVKHGQQEILNRLVLSCS
jgi:hypothetical protein